jgi:hypothetical protein
MNMKAKYFLVILIGLLFAFQVFTFGENRTTFKERTENWLKADETPSESQGGGLIGDETPTGDPTVGSSIGDALWIALGCSLIYGFCIFKGKRKGRETKYF